jgi:hypothetical protein
LWQVVNEYLTSARQQLNTWLSQVVVVVETSLVALRRRVRAAAVEQVVI